MKFLILALIATITNLGAATKSDNLTWISIMVLDNGLGSQAHEYYGSVENHTFTALTETQQPQGFFKLTNVCFLKNGKVTSFHSIYEGSDYGYSNTIYVRAETIFRIVVLDENFVNKFMIPAILKEKEERDQKDAWNPSVGNFSDVTSPVATPKK